VSQKKSQDYELAFTNLKNKQNITAHNLFVQMAENNKKADSVKAALAYVLAGECKTRQGKESDEEILEAGKNFLDYAKKQNNYNSKNAFLCASKCLLKVGKYDEAKHAFETSKTLVLSEIEEERPIVIVEDSEAVTLKLKQYLEKLGYSDTTSFVTGKDAIQGVKKMLANKKHPIFLLDVGLPDITGDVVASKILKEKLDSQIILITAEEKTNTKVSKTISSGVIAFIQKPFTIDDLKKALDTAESEFSLL